MLKYVIEKSKSMKAKYMELNPKEKRRIIMDTGIFVQNLTAVSMCDKSFKVWWFTYAVGVGFTDVIVSFAYTSRYYYSEQPLRGLLSISLIGILVPSLLMYVLVFDSSKRKELQSFVYFAGEKIYPDLSEECSVQYMRICEQGASKLLSSTVKKIGMIIVSNGILVMFSTYAYVFDNEIQLPVPVILPFTDLESVNGLIINLLNQTFLAYLVVVGNIGIEMATCVLDNAVYMSVVAICYGIDDISKQIRGNNEWDSTAGIDYHFRNILVQVEDFDRYLAMQREYFYWRLFLQPILLAVGVAIALFFYLSGVWSSGIGTALFSYTQLYIICEFGNNVSLAHDMLMVKFHEMPWYLMSKSNRLAYCQLVNRLQHGSIPRMGPFATLDFETLSNLTNRIYSFVMMLLKMLK